ncbi:DUF5803 family protein [Halovivax gelatinilyticus]|uniref:DUF5803 family protein n=1 Tax=Halovivax gelatinilyticus TaxID=2961597 RepID=UPI0020CA6129|nr:DUF5803 family protein [Halovivax gelatinilyticus]
MVSGGSRRLWFAVLAVALLVGFAGCAMIFGGISDEELDREQEYDDLRERNATVSIDVEDGGFVTSGEFRAVYELEETDELELYRSSFYRDQAIDIHSVRFWYENGTVVTGSDLDVDQGRSSTDIVLPAENGTLAFSGDAGRTTFSLPAFVEGSYDVTLPDGHRSSMFLFGSVSPSGYDRDVVDDRERLTWGEVDSTVSIRYYHSRDVPIFFGLVSITLTVGAIALTYTYRQVKRVERKREEIGIDVDVEDDDRRPPPGLQ